MTETEYERPGWRPVDPGWIPDTLRIPDPTPGEDAVIKVSSYAWVPRAIVFRLETSNPPGNRWIEVAYTFDDGYRFCRNVAAAVQAASIIRDYCGKAGQGASELITTPGEPAVVCFPIEPLRLEPGSEVRIVITNRRGGDALSGIALTVDRYAF